MRILGRTFVECCIDIHAKSIGKEVSRSVNLITPSVKINVIDLFAGSGNLLYQVAKCLDTNHVVGVEQNLNVYNLTKANFDVVGFKCKFLNRDYAQFIKDNTLEFPDD